jgi:predicted dehydrogenase
VKEKKEIGKRHKMPKKRYALVGAGSRASMYLDALATTYRDEGELVALCDVSQTRMDWHLSRLQRRAGLHSIPTYLASQFELMLAQTHPDLIIVTTTDATHHLYIIQAMERGYDVITEKPITVDREKLNAITQAVERTGRTLRVCFNARYEPPHTRIRELVMQGVVGKPLAVEFVELLDISHGADYFRRWHREKQQSGGLLVHKATHHFDLVNWWVESFPQDVFAMGTLQFYGKKNAEARGEHFPYDRYTGVADAAHDPFALRLDRDEALRGLYLAAEAETGYVRDRNVFGEPITIEDTMSVLVRYRNGVLLSYSLLAYAPREGLHVAITGTKGRLELDIAEPLPGGDKGASRSIQLRVSPMFGTPYDVKVVQGKGDHGGADARLLEDVFSPDPPADSRQRAASHRDGAASLLVGIAANESIRTGAKVSIDDLFVLPNTS